MAEHAFKIHLATVDGKELPSHFRRRNQHLPDHALAMKYLFASMMCPAPYEAPTVQVTSPSPTEKKEP